MRATINWLRSMTSSEWLYRDAHYLVSEVAIDADAAARWVPSPLRLAEAKATLFSAWFPHTCFGSAYREVGLFLPVIHRRKRAVHCPWMLVDDDVAMIVGRELLGYPKKLGTIEWSHEGDDISAFASRRDHMVLSMQGTLGSVIQNPPPMLAVPHRNVRASLGFAIPWIIAFTPKEHVIEVRRASLDIEIGKSDRDPLSQLGVSSVLESRLHRVNFPRSSLPIPVAPIFPSSYLRTLRTRVH